METKTTWEDSGLDCEYCGGQIFRRTDEEPTRIRAYHQCQQCGAQWSLNYQLIREGDPAKQKPTTIKQHAQQNLRKVPRWVWVVLAIAALIIVLRFAVIGVLFIRLAIPLVFIAIVVVVGYYFGRSMDWW